MTPLLLFYLEKRVILRDVFWLLHYTTSRCFESFVENVVDARRDGGRNKESTVVAETMKLVRSSSYAYQILYRSRNTSTKFVKVPHFDKFINNRFSKSLNEWLDQIDQIDDVEMSKTSFEQKRPIIIGFFNPPVCQT